MKLFFCRARRLHFALDVTESDPPLRDSPLTQLPTGMVSPHIAGPTCETLMRCGEFALQNIARYLRKESLEAEVSLEVYDRSS